MNYQKQKEEMEDLEAQASKAEGLSKLLEREIRTVYGKEKLENTCEVNKSIRGILEHSFGIILNANDFFWYSTAASLTVVLDDLRWVIPIYDKYGEDGLHACMAYIAEMMPIEPYQTDSFKKAYAELDEAKPEVWSEF